MLTRIEGASPVIELVSLGEILHLLEWLYMTQVLTGIEGASPAETMPLIEVVSRVGKIKLPEIPCRMQWRNPVWAASRVETLGPPGLLYSREGLIPTEAK